MASFFTRIANALGFGKRPTADKPLPPRASTAASQPAPAAPSETPDEDEAEIINVPRGTTTRNQD